MVNDSNVPHQNDPAQNDSVRAESSAHQHPSQPGAGDEHRPARSPAPNPFQSERVPRPRRASALHHPVVQPTPWPVVAAPPPAAHDVASASPLLTATDHRRSHPDAAGTPSAAAEPATTSRDIARPVRSGRHRFATGVVVGAVATGIFGFGGLAGAALTRSDQTPALPAAAQPVAFDATGAVPGSVHELVSTARPSIVAIHTTITATNQFGQVANGSGAGSGWVLSADGYIVTNSHVVADATGIEVSFDDGSTAPATLVGADSRSDLAVLHVDRTDLVPLPLGDSDAIRVGDGVVAIGNALDLGAEPTVTGGIVSAKDRSITESTGATLVNLIQTDAAISQGNSGGPLLDLSGKVIGINTAVAGIGENIGFAISINSALDYIDDLRSGQIPSHPLLGVNSAPSSDGSNGAVITDVASGTAAAEAGLQVGDVITAIDGEPIDSPVDLGSAVARRRVGDSVTITGTRGGAEFTVTATIGAREAAAS